MSDKKSKKEQEEKVEKKPKKISSSAETQNLIDVTNKTGNIYKSLAIVSKRARQINVSLKEELHAKLKEFASTTDNLEEVFENREQIEISRFYEKMPNPPLLAYDEFMNDKTYYRVKEIEVTDNLDEIIAEAEVPPAAEDKKDEKK